MDVVGLRGSWLFFGCPKWWGIRNGGRLRYNVWHVREDHLGPLHNHIICRENHGGWHTFANLKGGPGILDISVENIRKHQMLTQDCPTYNRSYSKVKVEPRCSLPFLKQQKELPIDYEKLIPQVAHNRVNERKKQILIFYPINELPRLSGLSYHRHPYTRIYDWGRLGNFGRLPGHNARVGRKSV